ncbi:MAG: virulence factor [Limibacillus sp.]
MAQLTIVYWRDIPAQVIVKAGRQSRWQFMQKLPERFEQAIDRAAMRANMRDTDSYLSEWRRGEPIDCGDDLEAEAEAWAAKLEQDYDKEAVRKLVEQGGYAEPRG